LTVLRREGVTMENAVHALDCIMERYGSYEEYFLREFELDHDKIAKLRDLYTEEIA